MSRVVIVYVGIVCALCLAIIVWIFVSRASENTVPAFVDAAATATLNGKVLTFATIMALPSQTASTPAPTDDVLIATDAPAVATIVPTAVLEVTSVATDVPAAGTNVPNEATAEASTEVTAEPAPTGVAEPALVEYTVQRGDSLAEIARTYGVSVRAILDANTIPNPDSLRPGSVIKIPKAL